MRRLVGGIGALVLGLVAAATATAPAGAADPGPAVGGDLAPLAEAARVTGTARAIVELQAPIADPDAIRARTDDVERELGGTGEVVQRFGDTPLAAVALTPAGVDELRRSPNVKRVLTDDLVAPALDQTTRITGAINAHDNGFDGRGQVVAVLDTGVERTHPFLSGRVVEEACFATGYLGNGRCPNGARSQTGTGAARPCGGSGCEHGTHVAGIIAGRRGVPGAPISGIARGAKLLAIQVFSTFPAGVAGCYVPCARAYTSDILRALEHVRTRKGPLNIASANLSLGGDLSSEPCGSSSYEAPMAALRAKGVAVVVAAGNDGEGDRLSFPACAPSAISVGATNKSDQVDTWYSNSASFLDFLAPGSSVRSSVPGGGYASMTGTSMATPHVAAAFALLRQRFGNGATVDQLQARLARTGKPITDPRNGRAFPRIDLAAAVPPVAPAKPKGPGYWLATADGRLLNYGGFGRLDSGNPLPTAAPAIGVAATPTRQGAWLATADGGVFAFGDAVPYGSAAGTPLNSPLAGIASTVGGGGYWLVAADGGVFTYGDAGFYGSAGNLVLNQPIVGMAPTPSGRGYWMVARDGGVFTYGDAGFYGSAGNIVLNQPIVGMTPTGTGKGYWFVAADGGLFTYGDAGFFGSGAGEGTFVGVAG